MMYESMISGDTKKRTSKLRSRDLYLDHTPSTTNRSASSARDNESPSSHRKDKGQLSTNRRGSVRKLTANFTHSRYDVVKKAAERNGFKITENDDDDAFLIWNDSYIANEKVSELKPYQKINHFPAMTEICRKDYLAKNIAKMQKVFPEEFQFFPRTWILPHEYQSFANFARDSSRINRKSKTFIIKPSNGAMGNGITLHKGIFDKPTEQCVVQEYIDNPYLIDGYKCDMRVYALITSCDPLSVFVYGDGLLRMATEKYQIPTEANLSRLYMHLTNYSVNKHNDDYKKSHDLNSGSKRSLYSFTEHLRKRMNVDVDKLWNSIYEVVIKTIIVGHPHLLHAYRMCRPGQSPSTPCVCFEILGFDIMFDENLKPWLIEVNRSPSFSTDERIDLEVKSEMLDEAISLLNIKPSDRKKNIAAEKAITQKRLLKNNHKTNTINQTYEIEKNRKINIRQIEQLKDQLSKMQRLRNSEIFENRTMKRFRKVFPPNAEILLSMNKNRSQEKYTKMLIASFGLVMSGKKNSVQQEMERIYRSTYTEEDVFEQLKEREKLLDNHSKKQTAEVLTSMPFRSDRSGRISSADCLRNRSSYDLNHMKRSFTADHNKVNMTLYSQYESEEMLTNENSTNETLHSLNMMKMKFPGKSDAETQYLLDKLNKNWLVHRSSIASYWLVKLDSTKRKKIINIVKSNVKSIMMQCWRHSLDIEQNRLFRIFSKIFNRLLWQHGHGLWNCFQASNATSSWETMFNKGTDHLSEAEYSCCKRVVHLCKDCLLIVYEYVTIVQQNPQHNRSLRTTSTKLFDNWEGKSLISKKMIRLYQKN